MISDFVKGRQQFDHTAEVQIGIRLHRAIDKYTDDHAAVKQAKEFFRPAYRLYSGAMVDVVFDHYLAAEPSLFTEASLAGFAQNVYRELEQRQSNFPDRFARLFPYMQEQDWLFHYRFRSGTEKSLGGVVRRAAYLDNAEPAIELFHQHYQPLQDIFRQFWPDLYTFSLETWQDLTRAR